MKNVKLEIIKIRTKCQYVGLLYYSEILNWAAQNFSPGRGLDIVGSDFGLFGSGFLLTPQDQE